MSSVYPVILLLIIMLIAPPHPSSSSSPYLSPSVFSSDNLTPYLTPSVLDSDNLTQCGVPIPYPFGISNFSFPPPMPGFEINCGVGENITLQLATTHLKLPGPNNILNLISTTPLNILEISQEGYLRVKISSILSCNQDSSSPNLGFSLEGTPYTFNNTLNKFTVISCDALVLIHSPDHKSSGCASFCATSNSVVDDGLCSGVGCCQASIPAGLKSFYVEFQSIRNLTHSRSIAGSCSSPETYSATNITYNTNSSSPHDGKLVPLNTPGLCPSSCTRALVLEQDPFVFSASDVFDPTARTAHQYSVVLDWAIGNKTCEVAIKESPLYACKENSYCYNVSTGGYRCSCEEGYTGNPYIGCEDIDECRDILQPNPCVGKCVNTKGNYSCPCPLGYTGNGRKPGEGCNRPKTMEIVLSIVLCFLFLLLVTSFWSYWFSSKRNAIRLKQKNFIQNGGLLLQQHISSHQAAARIFSAEELEEATENFDETRVLGRGGYGTVYKGILHDERVVAIKKAKLVDSTQIEQFINEVVILSQIHHPNVVKLLGCCLETQVPLLVYEFISNGTLFHHVHGGDAAMPWESRLRIAIETAAALSYLHSAAPIPIIHRDIKSMNILLDENLTAKVSDFGASRLVPYNQTHVTTVVQGTMGYLDPEYFQTSLLTEKSDVYSFGVVLVELLTKKKPVDRESDRSLASYFVSMVAENRVRQAVDRRTAREAGGRQLMAVADVAMRCLSLKGGERPRMKEVEVELDALRRLMKQADLVEDQRSHEEEEGEEDPTCINDDAIKESHVSTSDTSRQYTMESHLLSSLDLPR